MENIEIQQQAHLKIINIFNSLHTKNTTETEADTSIDNHDD